MYTVRGDGLMIQLGNEETKAIARHFGEEKVGKVLLDLASCADKWSLSSFRLIHSSSANLVFSCYSEAYGDTVLKMAAPFLLQERAVEYHALCELKGNRVCRVFAADFELGVILAERIQPGTPLSQEPSLDKRLSVFCSLYQGLHKEPEQAERFPIYTGWVTRVADRMKDLHDYRELAVYMEKAKEIYLSVAAEYSSQTLLHGDFHHNNMLLGESGEYVIIDPKGVIGDPIFDVPRFVLNEITGDITDALRHKMETIFRQLEKVLGIPQNILKKCLYVEMAMAASWFADSGVSNDHYQRLLEHLRFAEEMMNWNGV